MNNVEIWKPVVGYEDLYEVSSFGRVRSLDRISSNGHFYKGQILKQYKDKFGYLSVGLSKNSCIKTYKVHRLVAFAFIYNDDPINKTQVNHITEDKTYNRFDGLEWCTPFYNTHFGTGIERKIKATKNHPNKSKQVIQYSLDGEFIRQWPSMLEIQRELCYDASLIGRCCSGKVKTAYGNKWRFVS